MAGITRYKNIVTELRDIVEGLEVMGVDHLQQKTMTEAADIIESLFWTSVDERLPECNAKYGVSKLVWCADARGRMGFGFYQDGTVQMLHAGWYLGGGVGEESIKITHWMPIPKPPMT